MREVDDVARGDQVARAWLLRLVVVLALAGCWRSSSPDSAGLVDGAASDGRLDAGTVDDAAQADAADTPACVPEPELCNGRDDDCNEIIDDEPVASTWCGARCGVETCPRARPIAPMSSTLLTTRRPRFRWALEGDADSARLEVCRDRACRDVVLTIVSATSATPPDDLPNGVLFWRLVPLRSGAELPAISSPWIAHIPRVSHDVDSSTGTVIDVNGDGRADLLVWRGGGFARTTPEVQVYLGSPAGLVLDRRFTGRDSYFVFALGDVNGDGRTDVAMYADDERFVHPGAAGGLAPEQPYEGGGWSYGDVTGDGYADLGDWTGLVRGGPSGPAPGPALPAGFPYREGAVVFAVGDLDTDGYTDLGAYQTCQYGYTPSMMPVTFCPPEPVLWLARGSAAGFVPAEPWCPMPPVGPWDGEAHAAGDFDGDGRVDLAAGGFWLTSAGPSDMGGWRVLPSRVARSSPSPWTPVGGWLVGAACDLDGDGAGDLFVRTAEGLVLRRGGATLGDPIVVSGDWPLASSCLGDDDGDSFADAAVLFYVRGAPDERGTGVLRIYRDGSSGIRPVQEIELGVAPGDYGFGFGFGFPP